MAAILKNFKYQTHLQFDLIYQKTLPNYAKKGFLRGDDAIDDVTGWPQLAAFLDGCSIVCKFSFRIKSNMASYLKYNYFLDGDCIDNVTLRLWKFSDFCYRHTIDIAGGNIMFHILTFVSYFS